MKFDLADSRHNLAILVITGFAIITEQFAMYSTEMLLETPEARFPQHISRIRCSDGPPIAFTLSGLSQYNSSMDPHVSIQL